ncbi:NAD(P)H-hydrate dehydratase [Actibacterium sp. 188UL27-1]|uniref:NAD(P)H-hydrate dehydratase n=1 Tax=Actibacterium sp. 188UL27-1 TaxID=2786961 RepID=UPI00195AEF68|nr:NAD(P)H-hydrate dehydratase [Actibacterium sp. 188UL27-1]MBM7068068.1 NAD(P)H-hydrate dehydratase [Actibacterium sp. 188UL27-1]
MTTLLTAAQMRAIEQAAITAGEVTGLELMERAGRGVVEAILEHWPDLAKTNHRAVVLCGPGNNGGDGFVVARLLHQQGWEVEVFLYGDPDSLPADARANHGTWRNLGTVTQLTKGALDAAIDRASAAEGVTQDGRPDPRFGQRTLYIDALFGTGLNRPLPKDLEEVLRLAWLDICWDTGVSIDIPTGISADTGQPTGGHGCFNTRLVVTFHLPKRGHYLGSWAYDCAQLSVKDIGLRRRDDVEGVTVDLLSRADFFISDYTGFALNKMGGQHKYSHGHALILSGGVGKGGAARLAARGALRIGAGLVTVGCPPAALQENAARLDAVMLKSIRDAAALEEILSDPRINALCLGPGLGTGAREADVVRVTLAADRSTVLDADALTLIAAAPGLFAALHSGCVLTPHAGEFARLFPDIAEKLSAPATKGPAYSKVDATREAAKRAGCTVLFKGPDTVIAEPGGRCVINAALYDRAAPWLATAGSGDVLAGFITGLLARGVDNAVEMAAWLHVECARAFGPGLIAEDLPEELPKIFRALGL